MLSFSLERKCGALRNYTHNRRFTGCGEFAALVLVEVARPRKRGRIRRIPVDDGLADVGEAEAR